MVEKKICFFWGNEKMSWLRYMTLYTFRKFNPDWGMILYLNIPEVKHGKVWKDPSGSDGNIQDFFFYDGDNYFDKVKELNVKIIEWEVGKDPFKVFKPTDICPSHKSNFFKWQLLMNESCFYSDMDIIFTKSVNEFYNAVKYYDTGITFTKYFSIGFMFSSGNNEFFRAIYNNVYRYYNIKNYQGAGVSIAYTCYRNLKDAEDKFPGMSIYNIPMHYLYELDSNHIPKIFSENNFKRLPYDILGIHWYAGHPLSQEFNNKLNENNYSEFNNTLCSALEKIL